MLKVSDLTVAFGSKKERTTVVDKVSFSLEKNSILGIVGESGSGKSVTSLAILGLLPSKNTRLSGTIFFHGDDLLSYTESDLRALRGRRISMIFQEPMSSLNPTMTCGQQVAEVLEKHSNVPTSQIKSEVLGLFQQVKLPRVEQLYNAYPHQLSGGQKQRVMIAIAIACKPEILIADEPTTALDVTVQKEIIFLLKELQSSHQMSIIFISHDLELVAEIADSVLVMKHGKVVEKGTASAVFSTPKAPYTKALINSKPSVTKRLKVLPTVRDFLNDTVDRSLVTDDERKEAHQMMYKQTPVLEVRNLKTYFSGKPTLFGSKNPVVKAVDGVSFQLYKGETVGLVGESGCGKTTLGRTILHLEKATSGTVFYQGKDITSLKGTALKSLRKNIQIIFQDPFSSLQPRMTVGAAIMEPMKVHKILKGAKERKAYVIELLKQVGLSEAHFYRYPHEFSGGQRQRIGIARTLALQPEIIICDESVSALDVSVQAQVLNLLNRLKATYGFTYLFISHDLAVVKYMADQILVMNQGKIEEQGEADTIYASPAAAYTQKLIDAIPKGR